MFWWFDGFAFQPLPSANGSGPRSHWNQSCFESPNGTWFRAKFLDRALTSLYRENSNFMKEPFANDRPQFAHLSSSPAASLVMDPKDSLVHWHTSIEVWVHGRSLPFCCSAGGRSAKAVGISGAPIHDRKFVKYSDGIHSWEGKLIIFSRSRLRH